MKNISQFSFMCIFFLITVISTRAQINNYCSTPPFLTSAVPPNVLLVIDVSGSMKWSAYNPNSDKEDWCENPNGCGWTYTGTEEGYFVPDKVYKLSGNCDSSNYWNCYWVETNSTYYDNCPNTWYQVYDNKGKYKGSCLNFLLMSRIDLVRWAITGGKPYGCSNTNDINCDPDLKCTSSICELETHYKDRIKVPRFRINGILQTIEKEKTKPRFGVLFFSSSIMEDKVYIGDYPNGDNADPNHPYTYVKRFINAMPPKGSTATAVAMWEAYDYFKQSDDHSYDNGFDLYDNNENHKYREPHYFCDANKDNCYIVPCAKDFVILVSDGQWNTDGDGNTSCRIDNNDEFNSPDPVVPAYRMHHDVLRTLNSTSGVSYDIRVQKVYALGLFLGGTGEQSLKNVAMYGGFSLSHGDWPGGVDPNQPHWNWNDKAYPWDRCKMDDCCNRNNCGRGSACTPLPPSSPDWDSDGDGNPDTFLNAKNAKEIKESLLKFLRAILAQTSSGTSVSVISEKTQKGANLIQAVFYPEKNFENGTTTVKVNWVGFLNNFWLIRGETAETVSLREDTDKDKALSAYDDWIMEFKNINNQLTINLYQDFDRDGICDHQTANGTCIPDDQKTLDETNKIWEAGEILHQTSPDERKIWVNVDLNGDNETDTDDEFIEPNYSQLKTYLEASNDTEAQKIIAYIRGEEVYGARSRLVKGKVWKLSDIIYSTPQVVDYDDYSVVYVGANDGMLHAFKLGKLTFSGLTGDHTAKLCDSSGSCSTDHLGEEIWSFIPKNSLPYLKYLMDNDYCHLYYVDLTPFVFEATVGNETKLILIGGMRLGGACGCKEENCVQPPVIYCKDPLNNTIDCSEPEAIPYCVFEDGSVKECDSDRDGFYDEGVVGLSSYFALDITDPENPKLLWEFSHPYLGFSYSGPAVMKIGETYYVAFGSGPTNYDGESAYPLRIFVLKLNSDLTLADTFVVEQVKSSNGQITLDNAFSGRLFIYKEAVSYSNPIFFGYTQSGSWKGGVLKLYPVTNESNEITGWEAKVVMNQVDGEPMGPITAKVREVEVSGVKWLIFGEGRYFTGPNDDPTAIRRIYGVKANIEENADIEDVTNNTSGISSGNGWYIRLEGAEEKYNAERMITDPVAVDTGYENISFFITFQPTADICGFGGRTFVWVVTTTGGGAISNPGLGGKLFIQVSTGQIATFTKAEGRKLGPVQGVPSETAPAFVERFSAITYKGKILHIIER